MSALTIPIPDNLKTMDNYTGLSLQNHVNIHGGEHIGSPLQTVVQWFKTMTTNGYICGVKQHGWPHFNAKSWQRNYYEHIVRDENELHRIRQYMVNNPTTWQYGKENPHTDVCTIQKSSSPHGNESWMI